LYIRRIQTLNPAALTPELLTAGGASADGGGVGWRASSAAEDEAAALRAKLVALLESRQTCDADRLLRMVREVPSALADHTVLMARRGLHAEALHALVYERHDLTAAVDYCSSFIASPEEWADRACVLLRVLLKEDPALARAKGDSASSRAEGSGEGSGEGGAGGGSVEGVEGGEEGEAAVAGRAAWALAMRGYAFHFLARNGSRLPPRRVLALLPPDMPLIDLRGFMESMLPAQTFQLQDAQMLRALQRCSQFRSMVELQKARERKVVMRGDEVCARTGKPIGTSVFVAFPDGRKALYDGNAEALRVPPAAAAPSAAPAAAEDAAQDPPVRAAFGDPAFGDPPGTDYDNYAGTVYRPSTENFAMIDHEFDSDAFRAGIRTYTTARQVS
jgi:hypothetical protein